MSKKGPIRKKGEEQRQVPIQQKISFNPKLNRYPREFDPQEKETENDSDLDQLDNQLQSMKENAFKIDPKLKQKSKILIKEEPIEKMVVDWSCISWDKQFYFNSIEKVKK